MADDEGHNFKQLKTAILARSQATDWEVARKEWKLTQIYEAEEAETCLCGHTPIIEICVLSNTVNGQIAEVGNRCVKRFLGLRSDLIFDGIKRIRADISKSLNADSTVFFYEQGVLTTWEYDYQNSTLSKRALSLKQLEIRHRINQKVLTYIERRGI